MKRINDIEPVPATAFTVIVDGEQVQACPGESVLGLLFALGKKSISTTNQGQHVGAYCGMGICFSCTVCIDGVGNQRACQRIVREGMKIQTRYNRLSDSRVHSQPARDD